MSDRPSAAGPDLLERAVVRVRDRAGAVIGAGFLVGDRLVSTCAHIGAAAAGGDPAGPEPSAGTVTLDFPLLQPGESHPAGDGAISAGVRRWDPDCVQESHRTPRTPATRQRHDTTVHS